VDSSLMVEPE